MKAQHWLLTAAVLLFAVSSAVMKLNAAPKETAVYDDSGNVGTYSILGVDEATKSETKLLILDANNYLVVSGIGMGSVDNIEVLVATIAANSTDAVTFAATSSWFMVRAESGNPDIVWHLPGTTDPTALTGVESLQGGTTPYPAKANAVTFFNPDAVNQATMAVIVGY